MTPGARARLVSLAYAYAFALLQAPRQEAPEIPTSELPTLLEACVSVEPRLAHLEDYVPLDPRLDVRVKHRDRWFRLLPASLERPVGAVRRAQLVAETVDPVLRQTAGFGVADLLEVALRLCNDTLEIASEAWLGVDEAASDLGVTADAVEAVRRYPTLGQVLEGCSDAEACRRAVDFFAVEQEALVLTPDSGDSSFGTALAVRDGDGLVSLPPPFVVESAFAGVVALAERAHQANSAASTDFAVRARGCVERAFRTLRVPVDLSIPGPFGERASLLRDGRSWFVVVLVASLSIEDLEIQMQSAGRFLSTVDVGMTVQDADGVETRIGGDDEITDERGVIAVAVLRAGTRSAVVDRAVRCRDRVERIHGVAVRRAERHVAAFARREALGFEVVDRCVHYRKALR